ncbi:MAG TPA: AMP-binding protein [Myxococcales bacterium]
MPFDLDRILRGACGGIQERDADLPAWLAQSWQDPDGFMAALGQLRDSATGLKSRPGQQADFFSDLAVRHSASDAVALRAFDPVDGWQTLTYRDLHRRAAVRASSWAAQGVKAGAKVCLIHRVGPELCISLLAALRLGARFALLPPLGGAFVTRRIAAFAPDHLSAEPRYAGLFRGFESLVLQDRGEAAPGFTSHTYRPLDQLALVFSPLVDAPDRGVWLNADEALRGALRDGLFTFSLRSKDVLAAPGFATLQHLPALLFATFLRGATFLHLRVQDLARDPSLLKSTPIRALGVCAGLRDLLLRDPAVRLPEVSFWFRNPEEPIDWIAWPRWMEQCGLAEVPASNVLVDPAAGGSVLFSFPQKGQIHTEVLPIPGRSWALDDLNLSGQPAPGDIGLLGPVPKKGRPPGYVVLSKVRGRYHYAGTRSPRRDGRVFPAAEVVAVAEAMPGVSGASVVAVPSGGAPVQSSFVLLVFIGGSGGAPSREEIGRRIELQMGAPHLPDRIELVPLYPHRDDAGKTDDGWCKAQYLTGALHFKAQHRMYQALTALRDALRAKQEPG